MESAHLVKAFALLEATAGREEGRSLAELAADVGLPKSTAHRLLKTLCALGYMVNSGSGIYRQTSLLRRVANGQEDSKLVELAFPILESLHQKTGKTVNLGVLRFERVVYLSVREKNTVAHRVVLERMSDPCFSTALGRAIVAYLPLERQAFLLRNALIEKRTPMTVVDPRALKKVLDDVRARGIAEEENQTDVGVMCIAAPVFDHDGVVASISLTFRIDDVTEDQRAVWRTWIKESADLLTQRIPSNPSLGESASKGH